MEPTEGRVPMQRVVVVGCAGAGKTTLAAALAVRLGARHVERDALAELGSEEYRRATVEIAAEDLWVFEGAPYYVDGVIYPRADTVVALDYPRRTVMRRVLWRSLRQSDGRAWRDPHHPVRWSWSVWRERRDEIAALHEREDTRHATIVRLRSPRAARAWLGSL